MLSRGEYNVTSAACSVTAVCIIQTWKKITLVSLSSCIVQSNFRCASSDLQHLSLHFIKDVSSFHWFTFLQSFNGFLCLYVNGIGDL